MYPSSIVTAIFDDLFFSAQRRSTPESFEFLGLGYRKAHSYEEQHKYRKTAASIHCLTGIRNRDPSTQEEEWFPRRTDPAPCDLLMCGSANEKVYPRKPTNTR
jgi:hypothetical protein